MGNQVMCKPTNTDTDQTTGDPSPCHIYPKHHKICSPSKQTKINDTIDALQRSNKDLNRLFSITEVLTQCIRYQQMYIYMHTILAYLRDSLIYMRQVVIHMMDYLDAATTNIFFTWHTPRGIPEKYAKTHRI